MVYVYFLTDGLRKSYIGYTTNIERRYRQHSLKLSAGAKYTKTFQHCFLKAYVSGIPTKRLAMSLEWYCKRQRNLYWKRIGKLNVPLHIPLCHKRLENFFNALRVSKFVPFHKFMTIHTNNSSLNDFLTETLGIQTSLIDRRHMS